MDSQKLKRLAGFTMLELMVALAIVGVVAYIGVPQLSGISSSFSRLNARTVFLQDLKRAQAQSLTEGCRGIFSVDDDNSGYSFGCDYLAYDESETPSADIVTFRRNLPDRVRMNVSSQIIFNSRGESVDIGDILQNVDVTLSYNEGGTYAPYATGTLLGTGLFSFD